MINADLPITNSSEDILNRGSFARSLAETITKQSFPASFTIGLYGAWGSGKTSLLNMILENIKNNDNTAVILRFNVATGCNRTQDRHLRENRPLKKGIQTGGK